jgi:protein disulfide isomerase family A protein 5
MNKLLKKSKNGVLISMIFELNISYFSKNHKISWSNQKVFYAPWCGYCKKLKPDYSAAAGEVKAFGVLAAMDMDRTENYKVKEKFNITGYPTILYFKNGQMLHPYGGEHNKNSLIDWMKNPQPPKEKEPELSWADEDDVYVTFLTVDTFDSFISSNPNVLVMFYAP